MNGIIMISKKVAAVIILGVFLLPTLFGGAMAVNRQEKNDDYDSAEVACVISCIDSEIISVERLFSEQEATLIEKQLAILSKIYETLKNPKKGCLEKIAARFIGGITFNVLETKKIFPKESKSTDILSSLFHHREKRWGILTSVISYGSGKVYIPLKMGDRGLFRPVLRPIFWYYPQQGITSVRLGSTYSWPGAKTWGYRGWMNGPQSGVMLGFMGIHIKLSNRLRPDNHFLMGRTISIKGNQYCQKIC